MSLDTFYGNFIHFPYFPFLLVVRLQPMFMLHVKSISNLTDKTADATRSSAFLLFESVAVAVSNNPLSKECQSALTIKLTMNSTR